MWADLGEIPIVLHRTPILLPSQRPFVCIVPRRRKQSSGHRVHRISGEWFLKYQKTRWPQDPTDLGQRLAEVIGHVVQGSAGRGPVEDSVFERKAADVGSNRIRF